MSHETRTSPPTYPEILDIHDGAFSESIWGSDGFRTIKVSGQSDVVADSYKDDLTIAAGTNVTITTNASGDSVTIASTPYTAGNGLQLSGNEFSVTALAITSVQEAANQSAHLALTTQQGDVVVRADENKSYVRNAGTAGDMSDFTLLKTPTDLVLSVHGNTGAITANQIAAAVEAATDSNTFTDADHSKLNAIEPSATADQTDAEIRTAVGNATDSNVFTDADHTKLDGIEASATADQTNAEIRTAVEAATDSNVFTDADHTKLNGIATSANNYVHPNHSGEVTSTADGATVIADDTVDEANLKISNAGSDGQFLKKNSSAGGGLTWDTVTQTDTTYTHTWQDSSDDAILRLTAGGSGSGNDVLKIVAGSNIT